MWVQMDFESGKTKSVSRMQNAFKGEKIMKKLLFVALIFIPLLARADTTQDAINALTPEQKQQLLYQILIQKMQTQSAPTYYVPPQPIVYQQHQPTHTTCTQQGSGFYCTSY